MFISNLADSYRLQAAGAGYFYPGLHPFTVVCGPMNNTKMVLNMIDSIRSQVNYWLTKGRKESINN